MHEENDFLRERDDLVGNIIKACYCVKKSMGSGLLELNYKNGMEIELEFLGLPFEAQFKCESFHRGISCYLYYVDLFVDNSVVVEVKVFDYIIKKHIAQTYNYMSLTGSKEGLILNFGEAPLRIRRLNSR